MKQQCSLSCKHNLAKFEPVLSRLQLFMTLVWGPLNSSDLLLRGQLQSAQQLAQQHHISEDNALLPRHRGGE
jgi:hypothetical protein